MAKKAKLQPWTKEDIRTLKTRSREKENNCDRAHAEAKRRSDVSEGVSARCHIGRAVG
jgi:hypothetical protein